jgi:hypothetical protein
MIGGLECQNTVGLVQNWSGGTNLETICEPLREVDDREERREDNEEEDSERKIMRIMKL